MNLKAQHRIIASLYNVGGKRVWIDPERNSEVKEAITKRDIRGLLKKGAIKILPKRGISSFSSNKIKSQKRKGRQKNIGSRKGSFGARLNKKREWMIKIRNQKVLLKQLRDNLQITKKDYRVLYRKAKGGFFRSLRHIKLFIEEHGLIQNGNK